MIGYDHAGQVRFDELDVQFMSVCPLWAYADRFMKIHHNLAEICEFQSKCLTGNPESPKSRESAENAERLDYIV